MTLKEELEILRGEPISVFDGDPMDIPCIETSDAERLCKHPVVSVHMITYNHEPYIRQAIEGVMMQQTDFEFELVIGEDCSTDKTREICFEYQRKYPDKIRVLWWHENVSKFGGNGRRTSTHCKGEFIAYCEGDDFWIDPLKLQKQVDIMRSHPSVGLVASYVFAAYSEKRGLLFSAKGNLPVGLIPKDKAFLWLLYGVNPTVRKEEMIHTSNVMIRSEIRKKMLADFADLFSWRLALGDLLCWLGTTALSDMYLIKEPLSVYREGSGGLMSHLLSTYRVHRDGMIAVLYFSKKVLGFSLSDVPDYFKTRLLAYAYSAKWLLVNDVHQLKEWYKRLDGNKLIHDEFICKRRYRFVIKALKNGTGNAIDDPAHYCAMVKFFNGHSISKSVSSYYAAHAQNEFDQLSVPSGSLKRRCVEWTCAFISSLKTWLKCECCKFSSQTSARERE